jgi:hypothetical protein
MIVSVNRVGVAARTSRVDVSCCESAFDEETVAAVLGTGDVTGDSRTIGKMSLLWNQNVHDGERH